MFERLERIFEGFLGASARGVSDNGQTQFPCPFCESGKHNLEVNFRKCVYKSWCCSDEYGRLSKLIKIFGNDIIFNEYKEEIKNIRESHLYQIKGDKSDMENFGEILFEVPACCEKLDPKRYNHKKAYEYCTSRGITDEMISRFNIQCTTYDCTDWQMRQRIVIPSYDRFEQLNFWVGRTYYDNKYQTKYKNPTDVKKKSIIFNEHLLQWDGDIRLVEGPFDSIVIPNSTALLGKELDSSFYLYKALIERAHSVTLIPDSDAVGTWINIKRNLERGNLRGKVKLLQWQIDNCKDASDVFQKHGVKGIVQLLKSPSI